MLSRLSDSDGPPGTVLDNTCSGSFQVPGFGNHPASLELVPAERYAHGALDWSQPRMTRREIAMLKLINDITDIQGWHVAIHDQNHPVIAAKAQEFLGEPMGSRGPGPGAWRSSATWFDSSKRRRTVSSLTQPRVQSSQTRWSTTVYCRDFKSSWHHFRTKRPRLMPTLAITSSWLTLHYTHWCTAVHWQSLRATLAPARKPCSCQAWACLLLLILIEAAKCHGAAPTAC